MKVYNDYMEGVIPLFDKMVYFVLERCSNSNAERHREQSRSQGSGLEQFT